MSEAEELIKKLKETPINEDCQHLDICLENTGGLPIAFYLNSSLKIVTCTYQHAKNKGFGKHIGDIAYDFEPNFDLEITERKRRINSKIFTFQNPLYLFLIPFQPFELGETMFKCKIGLLSYDTQRELSQKAKLGFVSNGLIYRGGSVE